MQERQEQLQMDYGLPEDIDPADVLMEKSAEALGDAALLSLVLAPGRCGRRSTDVATELLRQEGSLASLARMPVGELLHRPGMDKRSACALHSALALANRMRNGPTSAHPRISGPLSVIEYFGGYFLGKEQEAFHVLLLDTKNVLLRDELVTVGLVDRTQVHAREVFRRAIRENCSRVILVHNHPSGDPTPSPNDLATTTGLVAAGKVIGIEVVDHVIIGQPTPQRPGGYVSLREENLLKG